MEILFSEPWGPVTFLWLGQRTRELKRSSVKGRDPHLICGAGLCKHFPLSGMLLLYLHSLLPLLWGSFLSVVSQTLLLGCRRAASLFSFCLCKTRPLSQLPETKNTAAIKQQPVKGFKNLHLGVTTEYCVQTEAEGRAQAQGMGWQHSSVRLEGPVAVAVTQPERQLS